MTGEPGQAASTVLQALVAEAATRPRWDEPPALYLVYLSRGRARLERAPIPARDFAPDPAAALHAIAEATAGYARAGVIRPKPGLYAAAFRCEAWYSEPPPGGAAELARDAEARTIYQRPDRREVRHLMAVDRTANTYVVTRFRDTGETRRHVLPPNPDLRVTGTIADALDLIVGTCLGVGLPPRESPPGPEPGR
jgi:hypothetical protein